MARKHVACTRSSAASRALDKTSAYRQTRASEGSSPARTSRWLPSLMAPHRVRPPLAVLEQMAGRGRNAISNFLLSHLAACRTKSMNKWSAGVFPFWPRRSRRGESGRHSPTRMDPAKVRAWLSPEDNGDRYENTTHASLIRVGRRHVSVNRLPFPTFCLGLAAALSVSAVALAPRPYRCFARAERNGSKRGARGNLSASTARRMAAITAACSSSVRSIVGMIARRGCGDGVCGEFCHQNQIGRASCRERV